MSEHKVISLHLHSVSPIHIADASAGESHVDPKTGYIRAGKLPKTMPVKRIERKPILVPKEISGENDDAVVHFPYIKSNGIVGRLRRFAQDAINEVLKEKDMATSDKTYRGLSCGAVSGTPTGVAPTLSEYRKAREHFYLGLFGGGNGMFASGMSFGDFNVKHKALSAAGVLPATLEGAVNVPVPQLTYPVSLVRRDRMLELTDFNIEHVVKGGNEAIEQWLDLVLAASKEAEQLNDDEKSDAKGSNLKEGRRQKLVNLVAYEAVLAGLGYYSKIVLSPDTTDAQIGLLLEALSRFAQSNAVGGKSAKGLGRFNLTVKEGDNVLLQSNDGEITQSNGGQYTEALIDELDNLDLDVLESFFA